MRHFHTNTHQFRLALEQLLVFSTIFKVVTFLGKETDSNKLFMTNEPYYLEKMNVFTRKMDIVLIQTSLEVRLRLLLTPD